MKRAVVTGLGVISSIGNNQKEVLASLQQGRSGISFNPVFKDIGMRSQVSGDIKLDITGMIERKILRFMSPASIYCYLAMQQAIEDSGLTASQVSNDRTGLIVGSGGASPSSIVSGTDAMREKGIRGVSPYLVTKSMASGVSGCLATPFKIRGVNYSISSACSTSAHCIGNAVELIQLGKQDCVFAGGGEEICWEMACQFDAMGALSTQFNDKPTSASRTYDAQRDGFVISGGGGVVVIEELEHALARNAHIYAEIIGYGATSDGEDMVAPSGEGAMRCMRMAMQDFEGSVDYLNTHGTSTPIGDIKELEAIKEVFGNNGPALSSTKAMTGHALGAAGVHELIYTLLMLEHGFITPSINIENLDENAVGMNIITAPTPRVLTTAMSNSFGFGGTNASLLMRKYQ